MYVRDAGGGAGERSCSRHARVAAGARRRDDAAADGVRRQGLGAARDRRPRPRRADRVTLAVATPRLLLALTATARRRRLIVAFANAERRAFTSPRRAGAGACKAEL